MPERGFAAIGAATGGGALATAGAAAGIGEGIGSVLIEDDIVGGMGIAAIGAGGTGMTGGGGSAGCGCGLAKFSASCLAVISADSILLSGNSL